MKAKFDSITIDFKSLLESAPNLFVALSTDFKIIGASEAILKLTGNKRSKILGLTLQEAFPFYQKSAAVPDGEMNLNESLSFVLSHRDAHTMAVQKFWIPKPSGEVEERYWSQNNIPILYEQKQVLCIVHKIEDVTDLERMKILAEEQLQQKKELQEAEKKHLKRIRESEDRFLKIFNISPIPIFIVTATDFKFVLVNNAFEEFMHLRSPDVIGKTAFELGILDIVSLSDLNAQLNGKKSKNADLEFTVKDGSGQYKQMLASSEIAEIDNNLCFIVAMVDITERKIKETDLLQSNQFLDTILENLPIVVFVKNAQDLSYLSLNKYGEKLLGIEQHWLKGKTNTDLYNIEKAAEISRKEEDIIRLNQPEITEEELIKTPTGYRWLRTIKIPVYENGLPLYLIGISEDITESKKQKDAILQLNKELEAFSYSVSHDLRSPLRAVTGYAQILDEDYGDVLDSEGKRFLHTISDNAERMGHLIDNLLTFSRLGRKEVLKRETDMNDLFERSITDINQTISHQAKITVSNLHSVFCDADLMTQVVKNLVENSIKYTSKKENPEIEISSRLTETDIVYTIKDNGVGFDMRFYDKLFGVFQRLHSIEEFEGTGVGLAIVQRIITKHGGKVWADGKVDEGAAFSFSLPVSK